MAAAVQIDEEEKLYRRRVPRHLPKRYIDVYVNKLSNFKCQYERALKVLLDRGEVIIHGLGGALPRATTLALKLQTEQLGVSVHPRTSTVRMTEDFEGADVAFENAAVGGSYEQETFVRKVSAIHIRLTIPKIEKKVEENSASKNKKTK